MILFFAGCGALVVDSMADIGKAVALAIVGAGFMIGAVALAIGVDNRRRPQQPKEGRPKHPSHGVRL
ncbi:hypothetical protein GCM10009850_000780 [Nonomuraea monospora]|uniref:Uncharacterized protein n=1 Tax=Nonomuraea monospora TaxID=568818 RepID=A0ABN3C4N0_9ACTN